MLKNIKYDIYQNLGLYFPSYFKRRAFSGLKDSLKKDTLTLPPENELLILQLFADNSSVVIDVGANNGLYCYYFQTILGVSEIHAIEPIPTLYSKLNKWFKKIHVYPFAISDKVSEGVLRIPYIKSIRFETRAKLDALEETNETKFKEIKIQTSTLDDLFLEKLSTVNFIKIDIEGHELNAVLGGTKLIKKHLPTLMIEIEARHHGSNLTALVQQIEQLGYQCCFFDLGAKQISLFEEFDAQKHQNTEATDAYYINNFLFLPLNAFNISDLNNQIKAILD